MRKVGLENDSLYAPQVLSMFLSNVHLTLLQIDQNVNRRTTAVPRRLPAQAGSLLKQVQLWSTSCVLTRQLLHARFLRPSALVNGRRFPEDEHQA